MTTMDDFEFDSQSFLEYLQPSFASLFILLQEAKECHTKVCRLGDYSDGQEDLSISVSSFFFFKY